MSISAPREHTRLIVFCQPEEPSPQREACLGDLIEQCGKHHLGHVVIPPLYHIAESSKLWKQLAEHLAHAVVLCWLHPRPACWLLRRHGITADEGAIVDLNSFADAASAWQSIAGLAKDKHPAQDVDAAPRR